MAAPRVFSAKNNAFNTKKCPSSHHSKKGTFRSKSNDFLSQKLSKKKKKLFWLAIKIQRAQTLKICQFFGVIYRVTFVFAKNEESTPKQFFLTHEMPLYEPNLYRRKKVNFRKRTHSLSCLTLSNLRWRFSPSRYFPKNCEFRRWIEGEKRNLHEFGPVFLGFVHSCNACDKCASFGIISRYVSKGCANIELSRRYRTMSHSCAKGAFTPKWSKVARNFGVLNFGDVLRIWEENSSFFLAILRKFV